MCHASYQQKKYATESRLKEASKILKKTIKNINKFLKDNSKLSKHIENVLPVGEVQSCINKKSYSSFSKFKVFYIYLSMLVRNFFEGYRI